MRQLVLVDASSTLPPESLLAAVADADPFPTPVVVFDTGDLAPGRTKVQRRPRSWAADIAAEDFLVGPEARLTLLSDHLDGHFPAAVSERTRALIFGCDTVVARCPAWAYLEAAKFFDQALFATRGVNSHAAIRASADLLLRTLDHLDGAPHRRRLEPQVQAPAVDEAAAETGELFEFASDVIKGVEQPMLLASGAAFPDEADAIGFGFVSDKARPDGAKVLVSANVQGIVVFGPYVTLDVGAYRYRVELTSVGPAPDLRIEAVSGGGTLQFASQLCQPPADARRISLALDFEIPAEHAQLPVELRLWAEAPASEFRLSRLGLARII